MARRKIESEGRPERKPERSSGWWRAALAVAVALLVIDSVPRLKLIDDLTASRAANDAALVRQAASPTGYAGGQRNLILPELGSDGYQWVMQTQEMLAGGGARIRRVTYDNFPYGRPVHWSSPLRWWLAFVAWVYGGVTSQPLAIAVESVAPWANTLLFLPLLLGVVPMVARRWGAAAASVAALGMVLVYPVFEQFAVGSMDHHGLAVGSGLLSVLFLVLGGAGWIREVAQLGVKAAAPVKPQAWLLERPDARKWFIAAGVAGAAGMWISAPTQIPLLVAIGLGGCLSTGWLARNSRESFGVNADPALWRAWGVSGALSSLVFYLIEYFPGDFAIRLEVNHPLYSLAWLGGGELVCRASRWLAGGRLSESKRGAWILAGSVAAVLVAPIVLAAGRERVFLIFDPFLWALHTDYIVEFSGLMHRLSGMPLRTVAVGISLVPLVAIPLAALLMKRGLPRPLKALVLLTLVPGVVTLGLACMQIRWLGISCAVWLCGLVTGTFVAGLAWTQLRWTRLHLVAAGALLAAVLLPYGWQILDIGFSAAGGRLVGEESEVRKVVVRDVAHWLRTRLGGETGVVLSSPSPTSALSYHGGLKGISSFYWENRDGLKVAAGIFGAENEEQARALVASRGITHLVLFSWNTFAEGYVRLAHGWRVDHDVPKTAFVFQLLENQCPPAWLRAISYPLPEHSAFQRQFVRIYEVVPAQTGAEALVRHAQFLFTEGNDGAAVAELGAALALEPQNAPGLITLAQAQLIQGRMAEFAGTFARVQENLPRAGGLELEDLTSLAVLCDAAEDPGQARAVLTRCLGMANEASLRRLNRDVLFRLLFLARQLGVAETQPERFQLGMTLLPGEAMREAVRTGTAP